MALLRLGFGDQGARTERARRAIAGFGKLAIRRQGHIEADDLGVVIVLQKIAASGKGTLISIEKKRTHILRSDSGGESWKEVYRFEPKTEHVHGAQGLRDIALGYGTKEPVKGQ